MADVELRCAGYAGSLRVGSTNRSLLHAVVAASPAWFEITEIDITGIPLYNADLDVDAGPDAVSLLREAVAASDALLIVSPEYNHSIPAVTKNVVDWLSRPYSVGPIWGKPCGLVAASAGRGAAAWALAHLAETVGELTPRLWSETLGIGRIGDALGPDGALVDEDVAARVAAWVSGFAEFVRATVEESAAAQEPAP